MARVRCGCGSRCGVAVVCGGASVRVAVVRIVAWRVAMARMRFVSGEEFFLVVVCMEGRTGFRHDFIFVILTELPAAITQTRGPYTCLKELQPGIPKSIGSVGLRFCCGKFCKNDGD